MGMVFKVTIFSIKMTTNLLCDAPGNIVYGKPKQHVHHRKLVNELLKLLWTLASMLRSKF